MAARAEQEPTERSLTVFVHGGGGLFRAHCLELDITYYGPTPETAREGLYNMVNSEVQGILEGKGEHYGMPDPRRPLAESLAGVDDIQPLFKEVAGPGPHRQGLK